MNQLTPFDPRPSLSLDASARSGFHLEEFKALKAEIAELMKTTNSNLQYALLASGTLFAWFFVAFKDVGPARLPRASINIVAFVPLLISVVFAIANIALTLRLKAMGCYIRRYEETISAMSLGWEHYLKQVPPWIIGAQAAAWLLLIAGNAYLGWSLHYLARS